MKINIGDTVRVVEAPSDLSAFIGKTGKVERLYAELNPPIAYVVFEEDELIARSMGFKVPLSHLEKVEIEADPEIPEGAKQITKADFDKALAEITAPDRAFSDTGLDPMAALTKVLTTKIVFRNAGEEIFRDREVVTMREDEFVSIFWRACDPVVVSESVDKKMSVRKCIGIALTAMIDLDEIVGILFGGSEESA